MAHWLAPDSDPGLRGGAPEVARRTALAFTESRYTMAGERSIHGGAVDGRKVLNLLTSTAETPEEPDIDGLLF